MKLTAEQKDLLLIFADDNDAELRLNYSGRAMYGRNCIGFVIDEYVNSHSFMFLLGVFLSEQDSELVNYMDSCSIDSMGLGTIVYFSSIEFEIENGVEV